MTRIRVILPLLAAAGGWPATALAGVPSGGGFEGCSTSAWVGGAVGIDAESGAFSPPDVPRFRGFCAFKTRLDGDPHYVIDSSPASEFRLRAGFYLLTGEEGLADGEQLRIFRLLDGSNGEAMALRLESGHRLVVASQGSTATVAEAIAPGWHFVEINWQADLAQVLVALDAPVDSIHATALTMLSPQTIDAIELGAIDGVNSGGYLAFDEFSSSRTGPLGTVGDANDDGSLSSTDLTAVREEIASLALAPGTPDCNHDGLVAESDTDCIAARGSFGPAEKLAELPALPAATAGELAGTAMAYSGGILAVGIPGRSSVALYAFSDGELALGEVITAPPGSAPGFGSHLLLDQDLLIVGTDGASGEADGSTPVAFVYRSGIGSLQQIGRVEAGEARAGGGIAISGNHLLLGSPADGAGRVAVFQITDQGLVLTSVTDPPIGAPKRFGTAIASSGHRAVVGAPGEPTTSSTGAAYGFELADGALVAMGDAVTSLMAAPADAFGAAIAVAGERLVIGAPTSRNKGAVDVYRFAAAQPDEAWWPLVPVAHLQAPDTELDADFGAAVAVDSSQIAVGAPGLAISMGGVGGVYRFRFEAFVEKLSGAENILAMGTAVALVDGEIAAGAPDSNASTGTVLLTVPVFESGFEATTSTDSP